MATYQLEDRRSATIKQSEATDFYERLGLGKNATLDEIQKAYHALAAKTHPDLHPGEDTKAAFKNFTEAYAVLRDPVKRATYDQSDTAPIAKTNARILNQLTMPKIEHTDIPEPHQNIDRANPGQLLNPKFRQELRGSDNLLEIFLDRFMGNRANLGQTEKIAEPDPGELISLGKLKDLLGSSLKTTIPHHEGSISLEMPEELKRSRGKFSVHLVANDGKLLDTATPTHGELHFGILKENIPNDAVLIFERENQVNVAVNVKDVLKDAPSLSTAA
jgi:curved DNA-binding protein CbpA